MASRLRVSWWIKTVARRRNKAFPFHKEADEVAGLYEQYSLDNNYKFKRIVQTKAVHKKFDII
ncbi:MAG: hypothetical protein IPM85_17190 [Chitinophagaceae bacterium]|nr:hypothetical protein [Chitinophagaceae bacterium]